MSRPGCNQPISVKAGWVPPRHARYALYWWDKVSYHTSKPAAETAQGKLGYHEAEDSRIVRL